MDYQLTHYPSGEDITYQYQLHPIEEHPKETRATSISYLDLAPDSYTFKVSATDVYGQIHQFPDSHFTIRSAWYQLWWVWLLTLGLIGIICYKLFDRYQRRTEQQFVEINENEKRMSNLKLTALQSQMNPHFVFNALGSIQYYIQKNEAELADEYLGQFAILMRMYLDASKSQTITLSEELELLQHYINLEQMRFEELFVYEFDIAEDVDTSVSIPTMILQPIVENAINHGLRLRDDGKGKLVIKVWIRKSILHFSISDNGIGVENAKIYRKANHKSQAVNILSEKIEVLQNLGLYNLDVKYSVLSSNVNFPGTKVVVALEEMEE